MAGSEEARAESHGDASAACPHCNGTGRLVAALEAGQGSGLAVLMAQCIVAGIEIIDGHVGERDAARLLGRSPHTLKRRRLTDRPIACLKYMGRTRYRLLDLADFKARATSRDEG